MKTQNVGKRTTVKKRKVLIICNKQNSESLQEFTIYSVALGKSSVDLCFA